MSEVNLVLTVECGHSSKRRFQVQTEPSDETTYTEVWFRICDGCAAMAERAGFDFMGVGNLDSDPRSPGGTE